MLQNSDVPSIHIEDASKDENYGFGSNAEMFQKLNAILDNTLNLSNIQGLSGLAAGCGTLPGVLANTDQFKGEHLFEILSWLCVFKQSDVSVGVYYL